MRAPCSRTWSQTQDGPVAALIEHRARGFMPLPESVVADEGPLGEPRVIWSPCCLRKIMINGFAKA